MQLDTVILLPMSTSGKQEHTNETTTDAAIRAGDAALQLHLQTLRSALFALLAGLLTLLIGFLGVTQAVIKLAYAAFGLLVWTLGVWLLALHSLQKVAAQRGGVWKL